MAAPSKSTLLWKLATLFSVSALVAVVAAQWRSRQARPALVSVPGIPQVEPAPSSAAASALDRGLRRDAPIVMEIEDIVEVPLAPAVALDTNFPTPKHNDQHHHH